ncbi:MAG: MATE family efflux transporter [Prevotella sp.]|nr:MATE family efflux transporter [Prevotella sp.]
MIDIKRKIFKQNSRDFLIQKNIVLSFFVKGWSVAVQLLLVPLTLACLGVYENGVWLTISSVLLWIDNLDVGLGNGLRNKLATYIAEGNILKAREMVSSTLAMLIIIIIPTLAILVVTESYANLYVFFNVSPQRIDNLVQITIIATIMVCATFILKFLGNFYMGLQLPAINNGLVTIGNTLALIGTYIVYLSGFHSLLLIAIVNTAGPLMSYLLCYPITFYGKYKNLRPSIKFVNSSSVKELFLIGAKFFVLQIAGIILFFSTNIIISKLYSPSMVTPYQIANRYFMVAMLLFTIICVPYWSATTDAYAKNDIKWIKRSNKTLNYFMLFIFALITLMIIVSPFIYNIWIGKKAIIPLPVTILVGLYQFVLIFSTRYSYVLNGLGKLKLQLYVTVSVAIAYIPLALLVTHNNANINALLILMSVINIPGLLINAIQYKKVISGTAQGIWTK